MHIRNVFNERELDEQSTCAKFAHIGNIPWKMQWNKEIIPIQKVY